MRPAAERWWREPKPERAPVTLAQMGANLCSRTIDGKLVKLPEYEVWCAMKQRCHNPKHRQWENYGGRGISVCEEWRESFAAFLRDMGPRPLGLTLDRVNNDGNYEPGNCRWATVKEQNNNRRPRRKKGP